MSHSDGGDCCGKRWSEWSIKARVGMIAAGIVFVPAIFALCCALTMWLWNWLMPGIFKLPAIGFWQAAGLLALSHILLSRGYFGKAGGQRCRKTRIENKEGVEAKA